MAQGNSTNFLTIPSQEGLFRTVRVERSGEENSNSPFDDEDDEDTEEDVRLIPRCSPVPRKRGSSIADETAEYMRIRLALPNRRVSFADATGGDLVDVKMFVPFDSDEEDDSRWEEEEARYRNTYRKPTYRVWPEFQVLRGTELVLSVHTNKLEVERITSVPDDPLCFEVLIRVLNISFHKSVSARSTMDGWITHFDYPAEYVQGSNNCETDQFSVKLSFASPYVFNGARIDFVVRYETSDGEFWANNCGKNYSVTLTESYEENTTQSTNAENIELRGILKPPRYRASSDYVECYDKEDDLSTTENDSAANQTSYAQPAVVQPEIDIETASNLSSSPQSARPSSPERCFVSSSDALHGEPLPLESEEGGDANETIQSSALLEPQSPPTLQFPKPHIQGESVSSMPTVFVHPCDTYEFKDSHKPDNNFQPDTAAQVPLEFGQPSTDGFSDDVPHIQHEDLKEKKDVDEIQSEIDGTKMSVLEGRCKVADEDKTGSYFHMLEESEPLFGKQVNNEHAGEDVEDVNMGVDSLSDELQQPLEKVTQEKDIELVSLVGAKTTEVVEVMLTEESTKISGEEVDDGETQSSPIYLQAETSDHDLTIMQELILELSEDSNHGRQNVPVSPSDQQTTQLASVFETSSVTPDLPTSDLQPSTACYLTEEGLTYHKSFHVDEHPCETHKDSENKLPLPIESSKTSTIPQNQTEETLKKCVFAPVTFFIGVVCLAVGIQDPSAFLVMGIFLLSLCF